MNKTQLTEPKSAYIFTTNRCNLACKYCYETNRTGDMTEATMKTSLDYIISHFSKDYHTRPFEHVTFTMFGGEPLLNFPVIKYAIDYLQPICKKLNFAAGIHILTNGTIFTNEMEKYFKNLNKEVTNFNMHVQVSLDGCKDSHDKNRVFAQHETRGSYDTIVKNIEKFKTIFSSVGIRQTVVPENVHRFFEDFKLLSSFGTSIVNFTPIVEGDWNSYVRAVYCSELKKSVQYYYNNNYKFFLNLIHNHYERLLDPKFNAERGCRAGEEFIGISVEGKIYPCHRFNAYSSIIDYCLGDVWKGIDYDGENYKKLVAERKRKEKCHKCKTFSCNRCVASYLAMGQPDDLPTNGYCELQQEVTAVLLPILRRLIMEKKLPLKVGDIVNTDKCSIFNDGEGPKIATDHQDIIIQALLKLIKDVNLIKQKLDIK